MGGSKRLLEEQQATYQHGLDLCVEAGVIEECEFHPGTYYDTGEGVEEALKLAKVEEDRVAIRAAYDDNSGIDYCSSCDNNMRD